MHLNDIKIKNLKPQDKAYKVKDGGNLYLHISPTGSKTWYATYRFYNKRRQASLGKYPIITLKQAREKNIEIRRLLDQGIDPVENKRQKKLDHEMLHENNFEAIAREWHSQKLHVWDKKYANTIMTRLSTYIFPIVGSKPINEIKPQELLHALKPIEDAGKHEMAHRVMQFCSQVFRYAVATGKTERDITQDLRGALKPSKSRNFAHLEEKELPAFLQDLNNYDTKYNGNPLTKWGFQILVLTFVRPGEIRAAKWEEIDWDKAQWKIPASRMKMKETHIVPLSKQTIALFRKIQEITGDSYSGYVLPSFQSPRKSISDGTFIKVINIMGYKGKATAHGFRHTASTILNENGFNADWIERQLSHGDRNQIRATYNYAQYLPQRTEMMQWYADYLEKASG